MPEILLLRQQLPCLQSPARIFAFPAPCRSGLLPACNRLLGTLGSCAVNINQGEVLGDTPQSPQSSFQPFAGPYALQIPHAAGPSHRTSSARHSQDLGWIHLLGFSPVLILLAVLFLWPPGEGHLDFSSPVMES